MAPLGQAAAGRKNLAKFLGIDMRAGTTGILTMMIVVMMRLRIMVMLPKNHSAIGDDCMYYIYYIYIEMRAGTTGILTMMILVMRYRMRMVMRYRMRMVMTAMIRMVTTRGQVVSVDRR